MPFIVIGEKDYHPDQKSTKGHSAVNANAPTHPPGGIKTPMKKSPSPNRSKPGDGKQ